MLNSSGVYKIVNVINNKCYIGSACNIHNRWARHKKDLNSRIHHSILLQRAWNKHGCDRFEFHLIETVGKQDLINKEQYYFDLLKPAYNLCKIAGSRLGCTGAKLSKETRKKMSEARKGFQTALGKHWKLSDETKKRMSQSAKGKSKSKKHKKKISKTLTGRKLSEETRLKMTGRKHSDETKRKMSEAQKGRITSKKTKMKISIAAKERRLKRRNGNANL